MNAATTRALRHFARNTNAPFPKIKRAYERLSSPEKTRMLSEIRVAKFSEEVFQWRGSLTQKEAADILDTPLQTYRNWEQGWNVPGRHAIKHLREKMAENTSHHQKGAKQ